MQPSELDSAESVEQAPDSPERLYAQLSATALDFQALGVPEEQARELWDLAQELRPLLPRTSPMGEEERAAIAADFLRHVKIQVVGERPSVSMAAVKERGTLSRLFRRLKQLRHNAWFEAKLDALDPAEYRQRADEQSRLLAQRLHALDREMPTSEEAERAARGYMEAFLFWQTLDRPSRRQERQNSLKAMVNFRALSARVTRCHSERDRVIFLGAEPNAKFTAADVEAIRADVVRQLEEAGGRADE